VLQREEAFKILRTVDDAGFSCTLSVYVNEESHRYEVMAAIDGLEGDDLNRLLSAMHVTQDALVKVDGRYLVAS
jgi:hypothetical protein